MFLPQPDLVSMSRISVDRGISGLDNVYSMLNYGRQDLIQEVFHVYLNKFENVVSHLFLIIFSNNKFTMVNLTFRNGQSP